MNELRLNTKGIKQQNTTEKLCKLWGQKKGIIRKKASPYFSRIRQPVKKARFTIPTNTLQSHQLCFRFAVNRLMQVTSVQEESTTVR